MVGARTTKPDCETAWNQRTITLIILSPEARIDLAYHHNYIAQNNTDAALKFFDAARSTFADLAKMPLMGSRYILNNPQQSNLRKWRIKGLKNYLIFYRVGEEAIEIVRILNAAQNIDQILNNPDDPDVTE